MIVDEYFNNNDDYDGDFAEEFSDPAQERAREKLEGFFEERKTEVFFSRQIEVQNENEFFHWITNRVLRDMVNTGFLLSETRKLESGFQINLLWHPRYRYYKKSATRLVELVNMYSDPMIGEALGLNGENMVMGGFARSEFIMRGEHTGKFRGKEWQRSKHNLDFIFEKDSVV